MGNGCELARSSLVREDGMNANHADVSTWLFYAHPITAAEREGKAQRTPLGASTRGAVCGSRSRVGQPPACSGVARREHMSSV